MMIFIFIIRVNLVIKLFILFKMLSSPRYDKHKSLHGAAIVWRVGNTAGKGSSRL